MAIAALNSAATGLRALSTRTPSPTWMPAGLIAFWALAAPGWRWVT